MRGHEVELDVMSGSAEDASASEPLIAARNGEELDHEPNDDALEPPRPARVTLKTAGKVVWLLSFSAGISGLLFGYDTGVVSSTLVSIGSDLDGHPLTTSEKSVITAVTSLFALLFAPATGFLADTYGRRSVILIANVLFITGAIVQACAGHVFVMVVGRAVVGAAIGLASCATPLYITELAPAEIRGRLVTVQSLFITGGQVVAYLLGWILASFPAGWRWMVGLGALPAIVQFFLLALLFETPRWLAKVGRHSNAQTVLQRVYGGLGDKDRQLAVDFVLTSIEDEISQENKLHSTDDNTNNTKSVLTTAKQLVFVPANRRALIIASMLQALQQLCGFNSLMYFSATIFALVGFTSPIGTSLSVALTNFVFTIAAFNYIDTVGRRKILLRSVPFMMIGLLASSFAFQYIHTGNSSVSPDTAPAGDNAAGGAWPMVLLISMILYVATYAIGLGCVPWQQSELFPLQVRSLGSGLATAANWSSNFVIGSTFLPMMDVLGASWTFLLYAVICFVGWLCIWQIYPETAGLELEGVREVLSNGFGVKESVQQFEARKRAGLNTSHDER